MENIIRHIRDLRTNERLALEHLIGQRLEENQTIVIQVLPPDGQPGETPAELPTTQSETLPEWCNVFAGLNDEQIADVEEVILQRSDLTRPS